MKSHNPYMSDKEFQKRWNKILKGIENNDDSIEEEIIKINTKFKENQERIRREDLEDAPYHKRIVK